jgi:hypothetical protein
MGTLADLRTRITSETVRDDLADDMAADLDRVIAGSIDAYANEPWWFNEKSVVAPCVVNNDHVNLPAGFRMLVDLFSIIGGVRYRMRVRQTADILSLYSTPQTGQPTDFALDGEAVFLWPKPNQAYPLLFEMVVDVSPALDYAVPASANVWTTQGQDLICGTAKLRLYRDYLSATLQDTRVINAKNQMDEAYSQLRGESNRRMSTGRVRAGW